SAETVHETDKARKLPNPFLKAKTKPEPAEGKQSTAMSNFFELIGNVRGEISVCSSMIGEVKEIHSKALDAITDQQQTQTALELDEIMSKIQKKTKFVQETLKTIDQDTKRMKQNPKSSDQEISIRESQYGVVLQRFCLVIQDYKAVQEDHQNRLKERLTKHVLVVNPNATKQEIDLVVQGEKVFAPQNAQQRAEARAALNEINKKHRDVTKLTESILVCPRPRR
ncbi:hypothetical protein HDU91_003647, partial [Kappamyces sp. JEL0680]